MIESDMCNRKKVEEESAILEGSLYEYHWSRAYYHSDIW